MLQAESWAIDQTLILGVVILCSIGLVMVSSATLDYSYEKTGSSFHFIARHPLTNMTLFSTDFLISSGKLLTNPSRLN